jgi:hypothetical protein
MKKIGLICAFLLAGLSLSACNNLASQQSKSSKTNSLKTYRSSSSAKPRKQTKKNTKGNHSRKSRNFNSTAATNTSNKENKTTTSSNNSTKPATQGNSHHSTNNNPDTATSNSTESNATSIDYDATDSYHGDPSRYRTGTRKPSTFSNNQDYQAYLAYYQGYNYDKSTGQITRMNDQQLNDMRQQMNKDGGQSFGQ